MSPLRILAFDHFFDQDLAALRMALAPDDELAVLPYQRLRRLARRHFSPEAFHGLHAALRVPEHIWTEYRDAAGHLADWWAAAYRPSVFVVPTDAIFYLRPVIERFAGIGLPTVVVQKETTISPMVMADHSASVAETVPSIAAAMTVCSERNREFWIRAGTEPNRIVVTGQPRFDVYASRPSRSASTSPERLLYLSYDDAAYLPSDVGAPYEGSWRDLRRETEQVLARAAATGRWRVDVKRHPQQPAAVDWLGPRVERAPRDADTRDLILAAAAVVGFQTTAIYEAVVADRPVLYPAWGPIYEGARSSLIDFDSEPGLVTRLASAEELADALAMPPGSLPKPSAAGRARAEEHLGRVDGGAAARVVGVLRQHAGSGAAGWRRPRPTRLARSLGLGLAGPVVTGAAAIADRLGRPALAATARRRGDHWTQEGREGWAVTRQG